MELNEIYNYSQEDSKGDIRYDESETSKKFAEEHLETLKQDREERKIYARDTFTFLCFFTGAIILIVVSSAGSEKFNLSDSVLITLITTSFSMVIGIFIIVMKYLFSK